MLEGRGEILVGAEVLVCVVLVGAGSRFFLADSIHGCRSNFLAVIRRFGSF